MDESDCGVEVELAADGLPAAIRLTGSATAWLPPDGMAKAVELAFRAAHRAQTNRLATAATATEMPTTRACRADLTRCRPALAGDYLDRLDDALWRAMRRSTPPASGRSPDGRAALTLRPGPALGLSVVIDDNWARQAGPARVEAALAQTLAAARDALAATSEAMDEGAVAPVLTAAMSVLATPNGLRDVG